MTIPAQLDGIDVVGLAAGSMTDCESAALHLNILWISEDAFGSSKPEIIAPNGSYGLYWASEHDLSYTTGKDYDLVPGVIDYTDAISGRVEKRGDNYVAFDQLEGMRLHVGSVIWVRDNRDMEFFLRVTDLTENGDRIIAAVEIPENVGDAIINYETTQEVFLTADDFIPADDVTVSTGASGAKTINRVEKEETFNVKREYSGKTHKLGNNDSGKWSFNGSLSLDITNSVVYMVRIEDSEIVKSEMTTKEEYSLNVSFKCKASEDLLKQCSETQKKVKEIEDSNKTPKEEKELLQDLIGKNTFGFQEYSIGLDPGDIIDAKDTLVKLNEAKSKILESSKIEPEQKPIGAFDIPTPYCNIHFSISPTISIEGGISYTYTTTNITKKHYNFDTEKWEVDYTRGNSHTNEITNNLDFEIKGSIGVKVTITVSFAVVINAFSVEFGAGIKASLKIPLYSTKEQCATLTIDPYMQFNMYAGVWVGKSTGVKIALFQKEWNIMELLGKPHLLHEHVNFSLKGNELHTPEECPLKKNRKVKYNTRTSQLIQDREVRTEGRLTEKKHNITLNDDPVYGEFLGWAYSPEDTEPTAFYNWKSSAAPTDGTVSPAIKKKVTQDVTLYAVWGNQLTVQFDSNGGTQVSDQVVPVEGYAQEPVQPEKEGCIFLGWMDESGSIWNFDKNKVTENMTLTAEWDSGIEESGGTEVDMYIGDINDVSDDCIFDIEDSQEYYVYGDSAAYYFDYEVYEIKGVKKIRITGLKFDPVHLVIPKQLPNPTWDSGTSGGESMLDVGDIALDAFQNCTSLKSVHFFNQDDPQYSTSTMFQGCTNLEYVELPALEDGTIQSSTFSGCTSLKCVLVRKGLKRISSNAFSGCASLKSLDLEYGITNIDYCAFENCTNLESVYIPDGVTLGTSSYKGPFVGCTGLKEISVGGMKKLTNGMLRTGSPVLEKLTIRGTVNTIGVSAFDSSSSYSTGFWDSSHNGYDFENGSAQLIIEEGVETIEENAFWNCKIFTKVSLPPSLKSIGYRAFAGCSRAAFSDLSFPELVSVDGYAFASCAGLKNIQMPKVQTIGGYAFSECTALETVDFGESLERISYYAFKNCRSLKSLYIPDSVTTLGRENYDGPFIGCTGLEEISVGGVETLDDGMLRTGSPVLEKLTIRGTVKTIGISAFDSSSGYGTGAWTESHNGYSYITTSAQLIIEEGVETIEKNAFAYCKIFTKVSLPSSLKSIGYSAFAGCSRAVFSDLSFPELLSVGGSAFAWCAGLKNIWIPEVQTIGDKAFEGCTGIEQIKIPKVITIQSYAFSGCTDLKSIDLGNSVKTISYCAFENCTNLESLYIPDSVTSFGRTYYDGPLIGCTGLKEISIGGVETLSNGMLRTGSQVLEKLTIRGTVKTIGNSAFNSSSGYNTGVWDSSHNGYDFGNGSAQLIIEEGVETIEDNAFVNCKIFTKISLPSSLKGIGYSAFAGCSRAAFSDLSLPELVSVGGYAFAGCAGIKYVQLSKAQTIGGYAFSGCTSLETIDLGENVETIYYYAFEDCVSLESLYIPDSVTNLYRETQHGPFVGCTGLKEISVGGVETLSNGMFKTGSQVLEKLTIRGTVKTIENNAFDSISGYGTGAWTSSHNGYSYETASAQLIIEEGVETIGENAFRNCKIFTTVTLPSTLTSIGSNAFANCSRIEDLVFLSPTATIADNSFTGCSAMIIHIGAANSALPDYCDAHSIPYDFITDFSRTLTLNAKGGSLNRGSTWQTTLQWTDPLVLPEPVWEGHSFSGWYSDEELTKKWTMDTMPLRDLTLYAAWDKDLFALTAYPGNGNNEPMTFTQRGGYPISISEPTRSGYSFAGWTLDEEGTTEFDGIMPYSDLTVYALWKPVSTNGIYRLENDHAVLTGYEMLEEESGDVYLPDTVEGLPLTVITSGAFEDSGVKSVLIPASVMSIEIGAFSGCDTLESIRVAQGNTVYSSRDGVVYSADGTVLLFCPPSGVRHVNIPSGVTEIGPYAFDGTMLSSVILPEGLASIGERAFRDSRLVSIRLPSTVTTIGERAFSDISNLVEIRTDTSPSLIGDYAFSGCDPFLIVFGPDEECMLKSAAEQSNVFYNAFIYTLHYSGREVSILLQAGTLLPLPGSPAVGENRQFTGWYLEEDCQTRFEANTMPASDLTLWAGSSQIFTYETVTEDEGETNTLKITLCEALASDVVIPDTIGGTAVTAIGAGSFGSQYASVTIPAGITNIEEGAFASGTVLICVSGSYAEQWAAENGFNSEEKTWKLSYETGCNMELSPVLLHAGDVADLPKLVRSGYTFLGWTWSLNGAEALETAVMPDTDSTLYAIWEQTDAALAALMRDLEWEIRDGSAVITGYNGSAETLTLPDTIDGYPVTGLSDYAFAWKSDLVSLILPDTLTEIGKGAFQGMHSLTRIQLPAGVAGLSDKAFYGCTSLSVIILPEGLLTIGDNVFTGTSLRTIMLPASLTSISGTALLACKELEAVLVAEGNPYYESRDGVLYDTADGILVKYPPAKENESYSVDSGVWTIGEWAFHGAENLRTIALPDDLYSLGESAFDGSGLTVMPTLGSMVTRISDRCFYGCSNMTETELSSSVKQIGSQAFAGTGFDELQIPDSVISIGDLAFDTSVVLRGSTGSYAESWAQENGIAFLPTDGIPIETISFTTDEVVLKRGRSCQMNITVTPTDAALTNISYFTGNAGVATVNQDGLLRAVGGGKTVVYASAPNGVIAWCPVTVQVDVESVTLSLAAESEGTGGVLTIGRGLKLEPAFVPLKATERALVWSSSNPSAAYVDKNGTVTGTGVGASVIRAEAESGAYGEYTVMVQEPESVFRVPAALKVIDEEAFAGNIMEYVCLPDGVETIGDRAFEDCLSLEVIRIPGSVSEISGNAFDGCNVSSIVILAPAGSAAQAFAEAHGMMFIPVG